MLAPHPSSLQRLADKRQNPVERLKKGALITNPNKETENPEVPSCILHEHRRAVSIKREPPLYDYAFRLRLTSPFALLRPPLYDPLSSDARHLATT